MQRNALQDLNAIDAAMASVGTGELLGIDVSPTRLGTHARMRNAMQKRQKHEPIDAGISGMIEPFESRMLPSTLLHPLTDSSFAMTLKNGATMTDDVFQTNGGTAEIASNETLDFDSGDFTVSASVQFQRNGEIEMIAFKNAREPRSKGFGLWRTNNGTINAMLNDGNGNYLTLNSVGSISDTTGFHDISMVRKNDILGLWIDGTEQQTRILEGAQGHYDITSPAPLIVGKTDNGYYQLEAKIKELILTKGAFTPAEMTELQKAASSPALSQETADVIAETVVEQQKVQTQIETYTEQEFVSFSSVPNGLYAPGQFHTVNLTPEIKIRLYSDNMFEVENGAIVPTGSGNDWIHVSLAEGQSPIPVSSVRVRYNPYGGGAAGTLNVLSEDDQNRVMKLSQEGDIPVTGPVKRVLYTLEGHKGALLGMTLDVTKTREVAVPITEEPAETVEGISEETLTTIAEVVASQEVTKSTLSHPLSDSSFAMTLKNGATMSDEVFQTNGGTAEIADNEALDFGSGDFTISTSVQFQRNNEIEMILFKIARGANTQGYGLRKMNDNTIQGLLCDGKGNFLALNSVGKITDTTGFHDISMVRKNDILGLWIDGVEQQTKIIEGAQGHYDVTNPAPLIVGRTDDGYYQLEAKIRELIVTQGAFTPTEISELQKAALSPAISQETVYAIEESVASQEAEAIMGPEASETIDEHAPLLRIVGIQGSNITLAASSPMTGGNSVRFLNLQDDGLFTNSVIQGVTDGSVTPVSLGMNAANGTGNYRIALVGGPNASTLASVEVHWDRDSKKLSLAGNEKLWECSEALGKAMNTQTQEVLALANNPMVGSGVLQAMQQESLIDGVRALPSSGLTIPEFESSFWNAHPEWKDDAIHETAIRESQRTGSTATQIYNRIVTQRNDTLSILRDAYGSYLSHMGDLLQEGVRVLSAVRNGGNEPDIRRNFAILVDQIATNLTMYKLSDINIRIPDGNTLLEAVKSVWTTRCEELIRISAETVRLQAADVYQTGLVAKGFVELPDGQKVAADDPRASTKLVFFLDEMNRPTLRPQGEVAVEKGVETYALLNGEEGKPLLVAGTTFQWVPNSLYSPNAEDLRLQLVNECEIVDTNKPLIVLFLGSNQHLSDENLIDAKWVLENQNTHAFEAGPQGNVGLASFASKLKLDGYQIKVFESGENFTGNSLINASYEEKFDEAKEWINQRYKNATQSAGIFYIGFSWGGGEVFEMTQFHSSSLANTPILGTAYIDAVIPKNINGGQEQLASPEGSNFVFNAFEQETILPHGAGLLFKDPMVTYYEHEYQNTDHGSIDNDASVLSDLYSFIKPHITK